MRVYIRDDYPYTDESNQIENKNSRRNKKYNGKTNI